MTRKKKAAFFQLHALSKVTGDPFEQGLAYSSMPLS